MTQQTTEMNVLKAVAKVTDSFRCSRIQTHFLTKDTWLSIPKANKLLRDAEWAYTPADEPRAESVEWAFDREIVFKDIDGAVQYVRDEYGK